MENVCSEVVKQDGVSWHFDRSSLNLGSLLVKEVLGKRDDTIQDQHCFMVHDAGAASYSYIDLGVPRNPGTGLFTFGIFFNFPAGAASQECPIISWGTDAGIYVYQKNGDLFVRVYDVVNGVQEINTYFSGINFCDGKTHLLFVERDSRPIFPVLRIEVFESYETSLAIGERNCYNTEHCYIGAKLNDDPVVTQYGFEGTKFFGAFYLIGKVIDFQDKYQYWKNGILPHNAEFFVHMDETITDVIYDSDYQANHGKILNYSVASRETVSDGFSWQNLYGYSTGVYVKGLGVTTISVLGSPHTIDDDELLPFWSYIPLKDIAGQVLEVQGRCRINLLVKDVMCYKGNSVSYANVSVAHTALNYIPGTSSFSVFWIAEKVADNGGCIIANGSSPNWRYRFDYNPSANEITWNVGGQTGAVAVTAAMHSVIVNIGISTFEIFVDGVSFGSFTTGSDVTISSNLYLFGLNNGTQILEDGNVALVGVRSSIFSSAERTAFFANATIPLNVNACWLPCSHGNFITDIAGSYHAVIEDLEYTVWWGKQSVVPHIFKGFTRILESLSPNSDWAFVPYDLKGRKIPKLVFGSDQIDSENQAKEGLPLFPAFIDFNPYGVDLGFFTYFWDKTKSHWGGLDVQYTGTTKFYWHTAELNMDYLETALVEAWWNYCFIDTTFDRFNLPTEIKDMILMNLGNNQKYIPVPIHY